MATPTIFSFSMRDANNVVGATQARVNYDAETETVAALIGSWEELGGALNAVSGAVITGGRILIPTGPVSGWKTTPTAGQDISDVGVFSFANGSTGYVDEFAVLAFLASKVSAGRINLSDTAVAALVNILNNTAGGTTVNYANAAGQDFTALRKAFQADRKHRRQLHSKSLVVP